MSDHGVSSSHNLRTLMSLLQQLATVLPPDLLLHERGDGSMTLLVQMSIITPPQQFARRGKESPSLLSKIGLTIPATQGHLLTGGQHGFRKAGWSCDLVR